MNDDGKRENGGKRSNRSDPTDPTDPQQAAVKGGRLRPSGGYRKLRSFQAATILYDATVSFCQRFLDKRSRTVDQMVQAARSGRQNIAEGSRATAASSRTELRLMSVARASLEELLLDYEDFLRQRGLRQWGKNDPPAREVRAVGRRSNPSDRSDPSAGKAYARWLNHRDPAVVANAIICLIHQANYLLDRQIAGLEQQSVTEGGFSEKLAAARIKEQNRVRDPSNPSNPSDRSDQQSKLPICPLCGQAMTLRTARQGKKAGARFWGCTGFPGCRGSRPWEYPTDPSDPSDPTDQHPGP
jgi:four helix bundle suffix protein